VILVLGVVSAHAAFPVKSSRQAIAIAKSVCLNHAQTYEHGKVEDIKNIFASLEWKTDKAKGIWHVSTVVTCAQRHMLNVDVPANGPYPTSCYESLYFIPGMRCPEKSRP
jgi:hypothetical protein